MLYGKVPVFSGTGRFMEIGLLSRNGTIVWKRSGAIFNVHTQGEKLVVHDSAPGFDHRVDRFLTIRPKDGAVLGTFNTQSKLGLDYIDDTNVSIDDAGRIYIVNGASLYAVSASGSLLWKKTSEIPADWSSDAIFAPPVQGPDGHLYAWTGCYASQMCSMIGDDQYRILSFDVQGKLLWSAQFENSTDALNFQDDRVVVGNSFSDMFAAFSTVDGKKLWSYQAASGPWNMVETETDPFGWTFIDAVDSNDYGGAYTRYVTALDEKGAKRWQLKLGETQYRVSGYSADGKFLFVEGDNAMYTVSRSDGKVTSRRANYQPASKSAASLGLVSGPNVKWSEHQFTAFDRFYRSANATPDDQSWVYKAAPSTANWAPVGNVTFTAPPYALWMTAPNYDIIVWTSSQIRVFRPSISPVSVLLNGSPVVLTQPAIVTNGVTLIPLRGLMEKAGVKLEWNPATAAITLTKGSSKIRLTVGSKTAVVNGKAKALEVAPQVRNGTTMVPLRMILETLNAAVTWDVATQTVDIRTEQ